LIASDTTEPQLEEQLRDRAHKAASTREHYAEEMSKASSQDNIFKYFLLVNLAAAEAYASTARLQLQSSFKLCKKVAYLSFLLMAIGVVFGLGSLFARGASFDVAKFTGLAGILTQLISGIFFYLYNKSLEQVNRFSDKLSEMQELALSFVANSNIDDPAKRDDSTAALAKLLLNRQLKRLAQASSENSNPES